MTMPPKRHLLPLVLLLCAPAWAETPFLETTDLFEELSDGFVLYRIPGVVVTANGTVLAYCEARKLSIADRGEIEIHLRRSTDNGRTWDKARQIAHIGPRLARNPHIPPGKEKKKFGLVFRITDEVRNATGLREGDVIIGFNRTRITGANQLAAALDRVGAQQSFRLYFEREGQLSFTDLAFR